MISENVQQVYFDEAGFTGNNLLDSEQPFFVYAGVAMDASLASRIHATAMSEFDIGSDEMKGANLVRNNQGRRAISWILARAVGHSHFMVANKEYALAGKFFEHIFEPVLADHNSLYYSVGFHKFVATLIHVYFRARDPVAVDMLEGFSKMMRSMDSRHLNGMLSHLENNSIDADDPLWHILAFVICHRTCIEDDLRRVSNSGPVATWPLELSMTALNWILASWGVRYEALDVYCDQSKPIEAARDFFQTFIGRQDKAYIRLGSQPSPSIIYKLAGPLNIVDSKASHGVQIADVMSSSLLYALKNPDKDFCQEWLHLLEPAPINEITPDPSYVDMANEEGFVNTIILRELVERSVKGLKLSDNMLDVILNSKKLYPQYLLETTEVEFR